MCMTVLKVRFLSDIQGFPYSVSLIFIVFSVTTPTVLKYLLFISLLRCISASFLRVYCHACINVLNLVPTFSADSCLETVCIEFIHNRLMSIKMLISLIVNYLQKLMSLLVQPQIRVLTKCVYNNNFIAEEELLMSQLALTYDYVYVNPLKFSCLSYQILGYYFDAWVLAAVLNTKT